MYLKKSSSHYLLTSTDIATTSTANTHMYHLFHLRGILISQRNVNETRIGIFNQDGLVHFCGFVTSKRATWSYVLLVSSKLKKET